MVIAAVVNHWVIYLTVMNAKAKMKGASNHSISFEPHEALQHLQSIVRLAYLLQPS